MEQLGSTRWNHNKSKGTNVATASTMKTLIKVEQLFQRKPRSHEAINLVKPVGLKVIQLLRPMKNNELKGNIGFKGTNGFNPVTGTGPDNATGSNRTTWSYGTVGSIETARGS